MTAQTIATTTQALTLNRAHKVVQRFKELLDTRISAQGSFYGSVQEGSAGTRELSRCQAAAKDALGQLNETLQLQAMQAALRNVIAVGNVTHGVTTLMAKEQLLTQQIGLLQRQVDSLKNGISADEFLLQSKEWEDRCAKAPQNSYYHDKTWSVKFLTDAEIEALTTRLNELKAEKVGVSDAIADANGHKVEVVLPTAYLKVLLGA